MPETMSVPYTHAACGKVVSFVLLADEETPWAVFQAQMADHRRACKAMS